MTLLTVTLKIITEFNFFDAKIVVWCVKSPFLGMWRRGVVWKLEFEEINTVLV